MELHWQPDPVRAQLERVALSQFLGSQLQGILKCDAVELESELDGDLSHPAAFALAWQEANGEPPSLSKSELLLTVQESRLRAKEVARRTGFAVDLTPLNEAVIAPTVDRHIS